MNKTGIQYLDYTWNPIAMRCTRCSPGCDNCWSLPMAHRLAWNESLPDDERRALEGVGPFVLRERELDRLWKLRKPSVIGVQFMGDLFHEDVPREWIIDILNIVEFGTKHTFVLLTKRAKEMFDFFGGTSGAGLNAPALPNLWLGLTVCYQAEWNQKKDAFLSLPGNLWISHEPALGPIDYGDDLKRVGVLISGGETGSKARPPHPDMFRRDRDQCAAAGVPWFFKQWGEWLPVYDRDKEDPDWRKCKSVELITPKGEWLNINGGQGFHGERVMRVDRVGQKKAGHLLDDQEHRELPWKLSEKPH